MWLTCCGLWTDARSGKRMAERAKQLLEKNSFNGAASATAASVEKFQQSAACYARLGACSKASSAANSAKSAFQIAKDAVATSKKRTGKLTLPVGLVGVGSFWIWI